MRRDRRAGGSGRMDYGEDLERYGVPSEFQVVLPAAEGAYVIVCVEVMPWRHEGAVLVRHGVAPQVRQLPA